MSRVAILVAAGLAGSAFAQHDHVHMTIDTVNGQDGDQILVETGWYQDEEMFSFGQDGYLYHHNEIHVFHIHDEYTGGNSWDGRYAGSGPRLTSDFFFPTGRLDGGDFFFEIVDVSPVMGADTNTFGWAENHNGMLMNMAESDGATREDRSFYVGTNQHMHHQLVSSVQMDMWDVTMVAWDANGMYTDSDAVTFRFHVVPAPAGAALLGVAGLLGARRRR